MSTQTYTDGITLTAAAEFSRFDTAAYPVLTGVAGTANAITAGGPANYSLSSALPPMWITPAATNTGATAIIITPSGGSALTSKNIFSNGSACTGGELVVGRPACIAYDGTQFNIIANSLVGNPGAQTFLAGDVALNNTGTYFDICNTGSIGGAGQLWLLIAYATVVDSGGSATFRFRLWDSSTVFAENEWTTSGATIHSGGYISAIVSPSAATTYVLSIKDATAVTGSALTTGGSGTANKATSIIAVRLR